MPATGKRSLMGASLFVGAYNVGFPPGDTNPVRLDNGAIFDKFLGDNQSGPRTPAYNAQKLYFKAAGMPGHWQTTTSNSPQEFGHLATAGVWQLVMLWPDISGVNNDGTLNATGLSEVNQMQLTMANLEALPGPDGTVKSAPGFTWCLINEPNNGDAGKPTTAAQYIQYVQAYGPYITTKTAPPGYSLPPGFSPGVLCYNPLFYEETGTLNEDWFPGKTTVFNNATVPLVTEIYPDFYCGAHFDNGGFTATSSLSANTKNLWAMIDMVTPGTQSPGGGTNSGAAEGCGLGIGEMGYSVNNSSAPGVDVFNNYVTYLGQVLTGQAVGSKGIGIQPSQARHCMWFSNGRGGPNYVDPAATTVEAASNGVDPKAAWTTQTPGTLAVSANGTNGWNTSGTVWIEKNDGTIIAEATYTGVTSGTFTGLVYVAGAGGTIATGQSVTASQANLIPGIQQLYDTITPP
jgi:hypothetical protein